jgi:aromatic-L-amino-acid decarboxylase
MKHEFQQLVEEIDDFYNSIREIPVHQVFSRDMITNHLKNTYGDFSQALAPQDVIQDVARMLRDWIVPVTHPHYFGLFNPSVHTASIVADALVAAFNPQLAAWSHAPAANEMERMVLEYFSAKLGFDTDTSIANFTTGGA